MSCLSNNSADRFVVIIGEECENRMHAIDAFFSSKGLAVAPGVDEVGCVPWPIIADLVVEGLGVVAEELHHRMGKEILVQSLAGNYHEGWQGRICHCGWIEARKVTSLGDKQCQKLGLSLKF